MVNLFQDNTKSMKNILLLILLLTQVNQINSQEKNGIEDSIQKIKLIKEKLKIDNNDFDIFQNNLIINSLYHSIKDSVETQKIQKHLDSFLLKKYDSKKFILALEIEKKIDSNERFEFNDKVTPENSMNFKSLDEFLKWKKEFKKNLERNSGIRFIKNDSINKN